MKKIITMAVLSVLLLGCNGGGDSSPAPVQSSTQQGYKTQLKVDDADLQALQNVKYASNDGAGFSTPENFQK
ncbi:hypothetical protein C942_04195 [Photobacterium marinum]|uniref:Lipoprotein n=1 Tax=Photobacterium marinum TaxID=1056511 RepID=L8JGE0_9GAMM|nr:hypothetical protein [Photobacterium marinum]ELR66497.1 hypothetical protein C942_04195 [Photobacterium marinum]